MLHNISYTRVVTGTTSIKWWKQLVLFIESSSPLEFFRFPFYNVFKIRSNYRRCHKKTQIISTYCKNTFVCAVCFQLLNVAGCIRQKLKTLHTAKNTVISPKSLVWEFCRNTQFPHSFGRFTRNYAETVPFHKTSTSRN